MIRLWIVLEEMLDAEQPVLQSASTYAKDKHRNNFHKNWNTLFISHKCVLDRLWKPKHEIWFTAEYLKNSDSYFWGHVAK